jgi:hypothetical protein
MGIVAFVPTNLRQSSRVSSGDIPAPSRSAGTNDRRSNNPLLPCLFVLLLIVGRSEMWEAFNRTEGGVC